MCAVHNRTNTLNGTIHQSDSWNQFVKKEPKSPWDVSSMYDFNFFCCPECDFKMKSDYGMNDMQEFVDHASVCHPSVSQTLEFHGTE